MRPVLPIVQRELRVAARRRGTYGVRLVIGLVGAAVFGWLLLVVFPGRAGVTSSGLDLFRALFALAFVYCFLAGARATADCLSEEKRQGTLGLLFLTDLKGYDLVLGKLVANSLNSVYGLLAIIPVLALSVQLGGVTAAHLIGSAVALLNTLFFSLATGLFVSAVSQDQRKAMFATLFCLGLFGGLPGLCVLVLSTYFDLNAAGVDSALHLLALSPLYPLLYLLWPPTPAFTPSPSTFWLSFLSVQVMSWGLLWLASRILRRVWQERAAEPPRGGYGRWVEQWTFGRGEARRALRRRLLGVNPFLWRAHRERWKPQYAWFYVAAVSGIWWWGWLAYGDLMFDRTLIPSLMLVQLFLKVWVTSEACTPLAEERRIGSLELLLTTPLTDRQIVRGQWLALHRQFTWPVGVFLVMGLVVLRRILPLAETVACLVLLVADLLALAWVGIWLGLTARSLNRALLGALGRILVLPWVVYLLGGLVLDWAGRVTAAQPVEPSFALWAGLSLLADLVFGLGWARSSLRRDFRVAAAEPRRARLGRGWGDAQERAVGRAVPGPAAVVWRREET